MIETLLMSRRPTVSVITDDVNVDTQLVNISNGITAASSATLSMQGSPLTSTAAAAIGYWDGELYVLNKDGVYKYHPGTLAFIGKTTWVGRTIPLNTSKYLHKGVLYFGQGRDRTGVIESLDLKTGLYHKYPSLSYDYGALYADDTYLYSIGNVYKTTGFSNNAIRRCKHDGTAWEDVVCTGTFVHAFSGPDATLVGDEVWVTGGGAISATGANNDGSLYYDIHAVNLKTNSIRSFNVASPGFMTYDMASCVWKGSVWSVKQGDNYISRFVIGVGSASFPVPGSTYHQPCLRIGDLFYYIAGYNANTMIRFKLPGGL